MTSSRSEFADSEVALGSNMRPRLLKRLYPYMEGIQRQPAAYLKKFFHVSEADLASPFFSHIPRWDLTAKLKLFMSEATRDENSSYSALQELEQALPAGFNGWNSFNQAEYLEAMYLLPGYILSSQGDRMAMANSIEGRYPFLDYRVVQFAANSPRLKMKFWTRSTFKEGCQWPHSPIDPEAP